MPLGDFAQGSMLMTRRFQFALVLGAALITLYFTFNLSKELFSYLPLKAQAQARISQWEVEDVKGKFALKAVYSFEVKEKTWNGSTRFRPPYFWNEPAAIAALKAKAKESLSAWYDPQNPSRSALEKAFPSGLLFRTVICYGVLIYFLLLRPRVFAN